MPLSLGSSHHLPPMPVCLPLQIFFDEKHREVTTSKLPTFAKLAEKLTGRTVAFGYMSAPATQQVSIKPAGAAASVGTSQ